jgi:hypothetical protein
MVSKLNAPTGLFDKVPLGRVWFVPKRIDRGATDSDGTVRIGIPSERLATPSLEVQVRLSPSSDLAIAETIYLWEYGPALDALLTSDCVGYRLDTRAGRMSRTRRWLYEYWPPKYQQFRTAPIRAAKGHLSAGASVVTIVSADLTSFYDSVGTEFLLSEKFLETLQVRSASNGIPLNIDGYRRDTASLIRYYERFRRNVSNRIGQTWHTGVPIGSLTSRLVANLALAPLDDWIRTRTGTLLFRRYVDDMVIVSGRKDLADMSSGEVIRALMPVAESIDNAIHLNSVILDRADSKFEIQSAKLKVHHLSGVSGQQFLTSVGRDFLSLVSERRSFLDGALIGDDAASHLARATRQDGSPLRVLRDADRVKLERFALSTSLRSLERISALVDTTEGRKAARRTQVRIVEVVEGEPDWFAEIDLLFRLLSLALATDDTESILALVSLSERLWGDIELLKSRFAQLTHRGRNIDNPRAWATLRAYLDTRRQETIAGSVRPEHLSGENYFPNGLRVGRRTLTPSRILRLARLLAAADLRARDREDDQCSFRFSVGSALRVKDLGFADALRARFVTINQFVHTCRRLNDQAWFVPAHRLFLLTRPPSYFDIARRILYQTERAGFKPRVFDDLLDVVNAIRGTEYSDPVGRAIDSATVGIPFNHDCATQASHDTSAPRLILGNLTVDQTYWTGSATRIMTSSSGAPVLTLARLRSLNTVLKKAAAHTVERKSGRPALLVLPELSIPRAWLRAVATHVATQLDMGLIAGVEYLHDPKMPWVINQVVGVFPGPFGSVATWPWTKGLPAREEATQLAACNPRLSFRPKRVNASPRVVVQSRYGNLSVLICSEMIEARRIADLLGRVELVIVPSWNTDTASYDHLVQSVGLQLNAIVAVANNGTKSDCRAWAPLSERWQRDLCRVIARAADEKIAIDLPLFQLREFRKNPDCDPTWRPLPPDWP